MPFNGAPVGTGPYKFVRWLRGDRIVLHANPGYFRGAPAFKDLTLALIPDDNTIAAQLRSHEANLGIEIPAADYRDIGDAPGVVRQLVDAARVHRGHVQHAAAAARRRARPARARAGYGPRGHHARRHVRYRTSRGRGFLALLLGLRRRAAADAVRSRAGRGAARRGRLAPGPDGVRVRNGKRLSLLLVYGLGSQIVRTITAQMQQMYRSLGVDVQLKGFDYATLYAAAQSGGILNGGKFDISMYAWIAGADPDDSSQWTCAAIPPGGNNVARYCSPEMDAAQRLALSTFDRSVRKRAYAQIQSLLLRDAPAAFIYYQALRYAHVDDLQKFAPNGISEGWNAQEWRR